MPIERLAFGFSILPELKLALRITVTLDTEIALKLSERLNAAPHLTRSQVINGALRVGLCPGLESNPQPYGLTTVPLGLRPGLNPDKLNQHLDDLEVAECRNQQMETTQMETTQMETTQIFQIQTFHMGQFTLPYPIRLSELYAFEGEDRFGPNPDLPLAEATKAHGD